MIRFVPQDEYFTRMFQSELSLEARRVCNKKWYNPDYGVRNGMVRNKPTLDTLTWQNQYEHG